MLYDNKQGISFPVCPHQVLRQHRRRHQPHQVRPLLQGNEHTFSACRNLKPPNPLDILHASSGLKLYKKKGAFTKDLFSFQAYTEDIRKLPRSFCIHRCS